MSKIKYQKLDSIAIVIIALSAVVVAIWQADITRQHNRRTVKPYLDIDFQFEQGATLTIKNKGEGAALITSFELEWNDTKFSDWTTLFQSVNKDLKTGLSRTFELGDVIGSHEEMALCVLPNGTTERVTITVRIGYESIYGEPDLFETNFSWGGNSLSK